MTWRDHASVSAASSSPAFVCESSRRTTGASVLAVWLTLKLSYKLSPRIVPTRVRSWLLLRSCTSACRALIVRAFSTITSFEGTADSEKEGKSAEAFDAFVADAFVANESCMLIATAIYMLSRSIERVLWSSTLVA